jgi:phosphatidylserine decarboxylase
MKIHKEGYFFVTIATLDLIIMTVIAYYLRSSPVISGLVFGLGLFMFVAIVQFFRVPTRATNGGGNKIIAPADGKVVVIEEVEETEFFNDKRLQVSIFMSPINVHANWYPISGKVTYAKYHEGKYLVAWHPKSSTENERTTVVVENDKSVSVLFRQIAGALARRIVLYAKEGDKAEQGEEFGFIKFGSRVDIFLPLGTKINVELNQKVTGKQTIIAELK